MHFHLCGIDTMMHDVTYTAFVSSSCASSLNVTPLNVSHRSFAAAVQRMDSEILRNLATVLIPENILPSLAGIPDVDWVNFMAMVKGGGVIRMTDEGRGIDFVEARVGSKRMYLCHIWDTQSTKPDVSLRTHMRFVDLLYSYECKDITSKELTDKCFKESYSRLSVDLSPLTPRQLTIGDLYLPGRICLTTPLAISCVLFHSMCMCPSSLSSRHKYTHLNTRYLTRTALSVAF